MPEPATSTDFARSASPHDRSGGFQPQYFEELAALEARNFWFRARNSIISWAVARYFPEARSFFEIGCGTGFVLSGLARSLPKLELYGSELFAEGLIFAAKRLPRANLVQMDARHIALAESVDVVGAFDVLEHIREDESVLREMYSAVRPGGGVVLTVPQHEFLWSKQDEYAHHVRRYAAAELRDGLAAVGFSVTRMTSFVSFLLPAMYLSRQKKQRGDAFDPLDELKIGQTMNSMLERVLAFELALIRRGVNFPAGGSLLAIAHKQRSRK